MNDTIEHILSRLENIHSVEPILGAQRTIAMGNWKVALNRLSWAQEYAARLDQIAFMVWLRLKQAKEKTSLNASITDKKRLVIVLGSERGLCGAFNRVLAEFTRRRLDDGMMGGESVQLYVIGSRAARMLQRLNIQPDLIITGFSTLLPTFQYASQLASQWLAAYENHELDYVDLFFNSYQGAGRYEPGAMQLIPFELSFERNRDIPTEWMETILETDPHTLFVQTLVQQLETHLYMCLIESAAAENSARYQLLEDARQNMERLTAELEETAAQAHRQMITREIQNLAIGAGLLHQA